MVRWQQTIFDGESQPGQLDSVLAVKQDRATDGVLAIKNEIEVRQLQPTLYWQLSPGAHFASDLQYCRYTDQNRKMQAYLSGEYRFYQGRPQLFLELLYTYEDMRLIYPEAMPYWTPNNFWTRSLGVDALQPIKGSFTVRGGFALTQQTGNELATNWKFEIRWQPSDFANLFLHFQDFGSHYYAYKNFQGGFLYRW